MSTKSPRKFRAVRAIKREPGAASSPLDAEVTVNSTPWNASMSNMDGSSRVEMYALVNDRYPGAPGTALSKVEEAEARAKISNRRELVRRKAANAELEHLGVKNLAKRRKSSSPYATSETGSTGGSDTEDKAQNQFRGGARSRRASSRNSSPVPLTNGNGHAEAVAGANGYTRTAASYIRNAPANPSPLAINAIAAGDPR